MKKKIQKTNKKFKHHFCIPPDFYKGNSKKMLKIPKAPPSTRKRR